MRLDRDKMEVSDIRLIISADTADILYESEKKEKVRELEETAETVKRELSEVYQVDAEHIDVTIQR